MANEMHPEQKISPYTLGIDFGTSNSTVAVFHKGNVEFLKIEGNAIVPSVVSFRDGKDPLIGMQAKRRSLLYPDRTISSVKMELGNPEWKSSHEDKEYAPSDIAGLILNYLREGVQTQTDIDLGGSVQRAVLCVPANFEDTKRKDLLKAAGDIGLQVRLLEEPVAAAIAYGLDREVDTTILVFDLGGGTFDVCILKVKASADPDISNRFEVLAKGGLSRLGGDDFDQRLMELFAAKLKESSGLDILDLTKDQGVSLKKLKGAQQTLKELAEKAKIELSEAESTVVDSPSVIKDESGKEHGLAGEEITREAFYQATQDLLLQTRNKVEETLKEAELELDDIDRIILAGGSTRMFMVKDMIKEMFGKGPWSEVDPTTIVSKGAAVYGAGGLVEQNRTSHYLGIELLNRRFGALIEKNTLLPAQAEKTYQAANVDPETIRISVYQSLGPVERTTEDPATFLGEFFLVIPEDKLGKDYRNVIVGMEMTDENLLKVKAQLEDENGVVEEVDIRK